LHLTTAHTRSSGSSDHTFGVLVVLLLATVSFSLAQTLVIPALATIGESVGASASATSWLLTGFLLSASVATPIVGKLGDVLGKGRVLTGVLLVFSVGSVVCALGDSIGLLIAGRVIQGVAGGVFPLAFGIIRDTVPPEKVPVGLGIVSAMFGIGAGIGLPLSGVIVDHVDLAWLFWISLLALPAAVAANWLVPEEHLAARTRIDWPGAVLLSLALGALLLGVTQASRWGWGSASTLLSLFGGAVLLAAWVPFEARRPEPLLDLRVLRSRAVAMTNLTGLLMGFAMFAVFLLIPRFALTPESSGYGFGFSGTEAGLILLPSAVAQLIAGPIAGRLGQHVGFRTTLAGGAGLVALASIWLALEHGHVWEVAAAAAFLGAGVSFCFASMANLIVAVVPQSDVGVATGINAVGRTVGGAFGSAAATAIITAGAAGATAVSSEGAYRLAFLLAAGVALVALATALLVPAWQAADDAPADSAPAPAV
jgi:EmrB/QacA subfamily drug resistance transporter